MMDCIKQLPICKAACCKVIELIDINLTQDKINYYKLRNCKVKQLPDRIRWSIEIPLPCSALGEDNLCTLHGTPQKPLICRKFDENNTKGCYIPDKCILAKK
jgi:hypothetical protein